MRESVGILYVRESANTNYFKFFQFKVSQKYPAFSLNLNLTDGSCTSMADDNHLQRKVKRIFINNDVHAIIFPILQPPFAVDQPVPYCLHLDLGSSSRRLLLDILNIKSSHFPFSTYRPPSVLNLASGDWGREKKAFSVQCHILVIPYVESSLFKYLYCATKISCNFARKDKRAIKVL